ncbi:MAG: hypothetical protein WCA85_01130 [Paraburkholderia sp.]|uniref:hypothetical protein n=1 Tax=Paraburkholderia sp. TaxID=1926495 RepID=UPI003C33AE00
MLNLISHFGIPDCGQISERSIRWSKYRNWAALRLKQRALELVVVPAVGGRLMNIVHEGVELAFVNDALAGRTATEDPQRWQSLCGDWGFPLWGGGKTWVAPESRWPLGAPHRDLDSGPYRVIRTWCEADSMGVEMLSRVCRQSGLQIRRSIEIEVDSGVWRTRHELANQGIRPVEAGIWDVLMLRRPGVVTLPMSGDPETWRDGIIPFVEKGLLGDVRDSNRVSYRAGGLAVRCDRAVEFKLGVGQSSGKVDALLERPEGVKRYRRSSTVDISAQYAHGAPVEIFNAPDLPYFEVETHAPVAHLMPGASCAMVVEEEVATASFEDVQMLSHLLTD